ncbi:MAG TPA: hypothetical protein VMN57_03260 [Anaerolineales bacterium]|nr:hypothetical protein [Anaerolineales bacterium]
MKNKTLLNVLVTMLVMVILFGIAQSASADVKLSNIFKAWDRNSLSFENGNVDIFWDGGLVEVYSVLTFDNDLYTIKVEDQSSCEVGETTPWAGNIELGFYHTDNSPLGAAGFQSTLSWSIVDCDFNGDGVVNGADDLVDLGENPPTEWTSADFTIITIDEVVPCSTGNCLNEIVTTMYVNLDSDCDGTPNEDIALDRVCFFAQAVTPTIDQGPPYWGGPLQARFSTVTSTGGGDMTVNFKPFGPTAITLENLAAQSPGGVHPAVWLAIFVLVAAIAFVLIRESRKGNFISVRRQDE